MGGSFNFMTMNGEKTKDEVRNHFNSIGEEDRYENGHSYSGGWGMFPGISFISKEFADVDEAEDWICENQQKWDSAMCVKFKNDKGETHWAIGGWASS